MMHGQWVVDLCIGVEVFITVEELFYSVKNIKDAHMHIQHINCRALITICGLLKKSMSAFLNSEIQNEI